MRPRHHQHISGIHDTHRSAATPILYTGYRGCILHVLREDWENSNNAAQMRQEAHSQIVHVLYIAPPGKLAGH